MGQYQGPQQTHQRKVGITCPYLDDRICAEIEKYKIEKEMDTKYKIAENILADMIKIFLADMGIRLADRQFELGRFSKTTDINLVDNSHTISPSRTLEKSMQDRTKAYEQRRDQRKTEKNQNADSANAIRDQAEQVRRKAEENINRTSNPRRQAELLKNLVLTQPGEYLFHSRPVSSKPYIIRHFNGKYVGKIHHLDRIVRWKAELEIQQNSAVGQLNSGSFTLSLSQDGASKPFLNSSGKGQFNFIRLPQDSSSAILIKANDDLYLQAYISRGDLIGNVYQRDGKPFEYIGHFRLKRKTN